MNCTPTCIFLLYSLLLRFFFHKEKLATLEYSTLLLKDFFENTPAALASIFYTKQTTESREEPRRLTFILQHSLDLRVFSIRARRNRQMKKRNVRELPGNFRHVPGRGSRWTTRINFENDSSLAVINSSPAAGYRE